MIETIELQVGGKRFKDITSGMISLADGIESSVDGGMRAAPPMLMRELRKVTQELQQKHGGKWNGSVFNPGPNLQSRSGQGLRSIYDSVRLLDGGSGGTVVAAQITTGSMTIHETGGTIRASGSGYLTIPLPAAMDPRGVPLYKRARQWDNTFTRRSKKGNLLIFRSLPGANKLTPLYILKKQVYIRPRLGLATTLDERMGYFDAMLFERISDILDRNLP